MKKINYKSISITIAILLVLFIIVYSIMGIFVTGVVSKNEKDDQAIIDKIEAKNKACTSIVRHSFKYVTFTCETKDAYFIYDVKGKQIAEREKEKLQFTEIEELIRNKYPNFKDLPISIAYGKKGVVYMIEDGSTMLVIDADSLKVLFHNEGDR